MQNVTEVGDADVSGIFLVIELEGILQIGQDLSGNRVLGELGGLDYKEVKAVVITYFF